ncbi:MAG: hypothetical protein KJZ69_01085 [Phycisphaerales bacterium]|nr:hypothetical protein [Phycisphaerales bacterium]
MRGTLLAAVVAAVACLAAARGAHAQVVISLEGACPGGVTLQWTGARPERPCALAFAENEGQFLISWGPCWGVRLGLGTHNLRAVAFFRTGSNGSGRLSGNASSQMCGGYLQMIVWDGTPCATSNVVQIPE